MANISRIRTETYLVFLFCFYISLTIYLYHSILRHLFNKINTSPDFDYAYLAPLVLSFIIWDKRVQIRSVIKLPDIRGLFIFLFGILMFWMGELGGEYYIQYLSFVIVLVGLVFSLFGKNFLRHIIWFFLTAIFFIPFPDFLLRLTTARLQLLSSKLGVTFLRLLGKSVYLEGNIIDLGINKLQVVDACSGLRYVLPLLVLSILVGYFMRLSFWKRIVLLLASIPIAILSNALRITLIAVLREYFGLNVIKGFFHTFEGLYVFFLALSLLMIIAFVLNRFFKTTSNSDILNSSHFKNKDGSYVAIYFRNLLTLLTIFLVLMTSIVVHSSVNFREIVPLSQSLDKFPLELNGWVGTKKSLSKELIDELDFSSYILADFYDRKGHVVNFYVAYYESQRKGESIHSPATCLRGGGWTFLNVGPVSVNVPGAGRLRVRSALLQKLNQKQEIFYWFQKGNRTIDNIFALKWYVFWDALTKQRTDGALIRIMTPLYDGESLQDAEQRLKKFVQVSIPELKKFLPDR